MNLNRYSTKMSYRPGAVFRDGSTKTHAPRAVVFMLLFVFITQGRDSKTSTHRASNRCCPCGLQLVPLKWLIKLL